MNNYCTNCGEKLEENAKNCPKCHMEISTNQMEEKKSSEKKKEKQYIFIVLFLYAFPYLKKIILPSSDSYISYFLNSSSYICATIILIYARITMHNSKSIKVMFKIFVFFIVLFLIWALFLVITCGSVIRSGKCD